MTRIDLIRYYAKKYSKMKRMLEVPESEEIVSLEDELICNSGDDVNLDLVVYDE